MRAALAVVLAAALAAPAGHAAPRHPWFAAADGRCVAAIGDAKRLLATIHEVRTPADALAFVRKGLGINERLLAGLRAESPPSGDRGVASFLRNFDRSVRLDREAVALYARGDRGARFSRLAAEGQAADHAARKDALRLGLRGCDRYLNPKTYG